MLECRDIEGFENYYKVYSDATVESYDRVDKLGRIWKSGLVKPYPIKDGYLAVTLHKNGEKTPPMPLSILVYKTFIGEVPKGYDVHHKNHIRTDNRVENLELIECTEHKRKHYKENGEKLKESCSKPIIQYNKDMKPIAEYKSISEAAKENNLKITAISNCLKGRSKTCGGYIWKYK